MSKIHLITFYTNKKPALDLSEEEHIFRNSVCDFVDSYKAFNPDMIDKIYTQSYPKLKKGEHARGCYHGFWKWKPHIILSRLNDSDVEGGDLVVYADCNLSRYKDRISDFQNLRLITDKIFTIINSDFLVGEYYERYSFEQHIKPYTMQSIIGDDWENYKKDPILHANLIYCKKSNLTINIVKQWESLCLDESLLLPTFRERHPLRWHTHDQAIISCLCKKLIKDKILPDDWPGFYYDYRLKQLVFLKKKNNRVFYNG